MKYFIIYVTRTSKRSAYFSGHQWVPHLGDQRLASLASVLLGGWWEGWNWFRSFHVKNEMFSLRLVRPQCRFSRISMRMKNECSRNSSSWRRSWHFEICQFSSKFRRLSTRRTNQSQFSPYRSPRYWKKNLSTNQIVVQWRQESNWKSRICSTQLIRMAMAGWTRRNSMKHSSVSGSIHPQTILSPTSSNSIKYRIITHVLGQWSKDLDCRIRDCLQRHAYEGNA